jgi:PAS domain S-box-containing protein
MRSGRSSGIAAGAGGGVLHRLTEPEPRGREQVEAFDTEGLRACGEGARSFGLLAITLLLASAGVSFAVQEPWAERLLELRLLGATAIGAALWHLRSGPRHSRLVGLSIILMLGATIEALAAYTGGASSVQHDRLNLLVLGASVLITWPVRWVALAAAGVVAEFLLNALATGSIGSPPFLSDIGSLLMCTVATVIIGTVRERRRLEAFEARRARELAARRLAEQEARYRSVVETAGSAFIVLDPDYRILEFNAEAERISGRRREDVLGHDYLRLFVPEHGWPAVRAIGSAVLAGEPTGIQQSVFRRTDGTKRIVHWKNACLRDADGRPVAILGAGQDVTEKSRAERALQQSEARLRRLVETTKAIPWEADATTFCFTYVGPQAATLGYPLEEWTRPDFWAAHIHPDDRLYALAECLSASRQLPEYDLEYRMIAADGRVVWLHDLVSVEARDGTPWRLRGFLIDITERKAAEEEVGRLNEELEARVLARTAELRASEARLRSILDASPLGGGVLADDARLVETNPALHRLLGRSACDGVALADIVHADDRATMQAALEDLRERRADVRTIESRYLRQDGAAVWAHTSLVATGADHGPRRVFAMIEDITARLRKQAVAEGERLALRLLAQGRGLEAALGALLECLERNDDEPICSVLVADEQGRLRHGAAPRLDDRLRHAFDGIEIGARAKNDCSTAAERGAAVIIEDVEQDPLWVPFRPLAAAHGVRACWWQPIQSAAGHLLGTFAMYHRTPRGPTDDERALLEGAAGAVAVVIERQRLDDLVDRHRNELAHVGRVSLLAELAGGLAHEMQQPLAAIANYAGGCERLLRAGTVELEQLLDGMERIQNTALRAGQIIRGIRALAQKRTPRRERVDVNDVARAAQQLIEGRARQHGVAIRLDLGASVPPVQADRIQLEQVLLNLLSNGLEAMAERVGTITIHTRLRDDGAVAVAVEDAGHGIHEDVAGHMFEPFFTTKATGLGLGLSIGRTIVESHEGKMWAAPALGEGGGAVVGFSLPPAIEGTPGTRGVRVARSGADDLSDRRISGGRRRARARH